MTILHVESRLAVSSLISFLAQANAKFHEAETGKNLLVQVVLYNKERL